MSNYEPLVTDFVGQAGESGDQYEHTKFLLENGYGLSVIRLTPELIKESADAGDPLEYAEGAFDVQAAMKIQDANAREFYEFLGILPYSADEVDLPEILPIKGSRATNLTSTQVNEILHKLNALESVA